MTELALAGPARLVPAAVRGIVFDLDGTLVDSYAAIAASLNHARAAFDLSPLPVAEVRRRVGHGLESLIAELVGPERVAAGVAAFRERYAQVWAPLTVALPGAAPTLAELARRDFRLAVASNKPSRFSEAILAGLGLRAHLAWVAGPEEAGSHKPEPEMLELCLARLGLARAESLYVGDMVLDVETARRAGVPLVLVRGGSSDDAELAATGAPVLAGLPELCTLLGTPGAR